MLRGNAQLQILSAATFINTVGAGMFATSAVLYFTRFAGLSAGQVGIGLTIAGCCGLLVGVPAGHLADRRGPREVLVALMVLQAITMGCYVLAGSFAEFLVTACAVMMTMQAAMAVRSGLLGYLLPESERVAVQAFLRAVTNVGFSLGAPLAALGILVGSRGAYQALILANALSFALAAVLTARLPHVAPQPRRAGGRRMVALRDRPYLAVTALIAVLSLHASLLDVGIPLWVSSHTDAPTVMVSVIFIGNCVLVALFSVRFARGSDTVPGAARAAVRGGLLLAAACAVFAASDGAGAVAASVLLIVAAIIHVGGEMIQSASSWGLGYGLAPDHVQGQYQGVASTALALAGTVGPALMAAVVSAGALGWLVFGALFVGAGCATVPVAAWAARNRPDEPDRQKVATADQRGFLSEQSLDAGP